MGKIPMPGYGIAIIDKSQFGEIEFEGEDRFDTPQAGKLIYLRDTDKTKTFEEGVFGDLLDKKIYWRKYADQDATFTDDTHGDIVFIALDKIVGFEEQS